MPELKKPVIFNQGNLYHFGQDNPQARMPKLPVGTYLVRLAMEGFYLEKIPDFDIPSKLYGDIEKKAARILNTFNDRPKTTGVLLSGEKGSGKTLLSKLICANGQLEGYPTLVVNQAFAGDSFNTFIQQFEQPCVVLFDEFEKVYDGDEQQSLLTLFDGVFTTKKLLLLTTNDYIRINSHLQNRPGRLYYMLDFKGLDKNFILEYGQEHLKNKSHLSNLGIVASMVNPISFDILQAIVEECNRYDESPVEALNMLNVKSENGYRETFDIELELLNGKKAINHIESIFVNPFLTFEVDYQVERKTKTKTVKVGESVYFAPKDMQAFNGITGVYEFENKTARVKLTRKQPDTRTNYEKYEHLAYID